MAVRHRSLAASQTAGKFAGIRVIGGDGKKMGELTEKTVR
jgi:hypothetical protein